MKSQMVLFCWGGGGSFFLSRHGLQVRGPAVVTILQPKPLHWRMAEMFHCSSRFCLSHKSSSS
jgi:hypothetical protein